MDEEKTIDEAVEEQADEMKEFEPIAFDEVIKDEPAKESAPVLRDAPEPADMNMIHKHLDNFLAKIAGETPLDENVQDSTEYWLNRIAEAGGGGGGGTAVYIHIVQGYFSTKWRFNALFITGNDTPFTESTLANYLKDNGFTISADKIYPATGHENTNPIFGLNVQVSGGDVVNLTMQEYDSSTGNPTSSGTGGITITDVVIAIA